MSAANPDAAAASIAEPLRVGPVERSAISVARALFGQGTYLAIEPTLAAKMPLQKLGPSAMAVLKDTLGKGTVKILARLGGARPRLRAGAPAGSKPVRVFDLRPVPTIAFGPFTFELVRWLTSVPLDDASSPALEAVPETLGDELLAYLAIRLVEGQRMERRVASQQGMRSSPLVWLGHARVLSRHETAGDLEPKAPAFDTLLAREEGRLFVECLAADLARRWHDTAHWSDHVLEPQHALRIVNAERRTLDAFMDAVERVGRWDLATFLVDAGIRLVGRGLKIYDIAGRAAPPIRAEGSLRTRTETRRRAGAIYQALVRMGARREHLSLVRFFEDGYDDAQSLLMAWDGLGRDGFLRAAEVIRALDSLDALPGHASTNDTKNADGKES